MSILVFLWPHPPISFPAHSVGEFPVPLALAAFNLCRSMGGLSEGCEVIPHRGFNWHFGKSCPEPLFMRSMAIRMPSLENVRLDLCLYSCWVHFFFFFNLELREQFASLETNSLFLTSVANIYFPTSRGSSQPRDGTQVSHIAGRFFTSWATGKPEQFINYKYLLCLCCLEEIKSIR